MASPATAAQQHQGLPSITTLTNGLRPSAPISPDQQSTSDTTRDSGTWPQPQNKRKSHGATVSERFASHVLPRVERRPGSAQACLQRLSPFLCSLLMPLCASSCSAPCSACADNSQTTRRTVASRFTRSSITRTSHLLEARSRTHHHLRGFRPLRLLSFHQSTKDLLTTMPIERATTATTAEIATTETASAAN